MSDARTWSKVGVLLILGAISASAAWDSSQDPDTSSESQEAPTERFRHGGQDTNKNHVSDKWLSGEVKRDCRGCHQWDTQPVAGATFEMEVHVGLDTVCKSCHFAGLIYPDVNGANARLDPVRTWQFSFLHRDHGEMNCIECHAPEDSRVPEDIPIPRGAQFCAECHDESPEQGRKSLLEGYDKAKLIQGFLDRLNASAEKRSEQSAGFLHREHLVAPKIPLSLPEQLRKERGSCTKCHQALFDEAPARDSIPCRSAKFSFERSADDAENKGSCSECHLPRPDSGVKVSMKAETSPGLSLSKNTFRHFDHLGFKGRNDRSSDDAYEVVESKSCGACHDYTREKPTDDSCYSYTRLVADAQGAAYSYEGCESCHTQWTEGAPHKGWAERKCVLCHDFPGLDLSKERRHVFALRARTIEFEFSKSTHPFISSYSPEKSNKCSDCHRAPVTALPSRIIKSKFDHSVHLSNDAVGNDQCETCHTPALVRNTGKDAALGSSRVHADKLARSFDPDSCSECHKGTVDFVGTPANLGDAAEGSPRNPDTVDFPHDLHVDVDWQGDKMGCATCHSFPETPGARVGVKEGYDSCTACHGHDEKRFEDTAGVAQAEVDHCAECHKFGFPSIDPATPYPESVPELFLTAVSGAQNHPANRACETCHLDPPTVLEPTLAMFGVRLLPERSDSTETAKAKKKILHDTRGKPPNCWGCHWGDLGETTIDRAAKRAAPPWLGNRDPRSVRRLYDDVGDTYPGQKSWDQVPEEGQ